MSRRLAELIVPLSRIGKFRIPLGVEVIEVFPRDAQDIAGECVRLMVEGPILPEHHGGIRAAIHRVTIDDLEERAAKVAREFAA